MKFPLFLTILSFFGFQLVRGQALQVGDTVPDYTFQEVLNGDQMPISLSSQNKPLLIDFWATWCAPCIPTLHKMEKWQVEFEGQMEFISVSADSKENLSRFLQSSPLSIPVVYDTTHREIFPYRYVPHCVLIDAQGVVRAIGSSKKLNKELLQNLITGKDLGIIEDENPTVSDHHLLKTYQEKAFQYRLSSEQKGWSFKNEIQRDEEGRPKALDFRNVSLYRLLADVYQLSSVARIYSKEDVAAHRKYCFSLEQDPQYPLDLLEHAQAILNSHLEFEARWQAVVQDSVCVLEVLDSTKLPSISIEEERYFEYRGPYYLGKKVTSYDLIKYLENEVQLPVKDKARLDYTFDMELNWSYGDGKTLNRELAKYGLVIKWSEQPEEVKLLVLEPKIGEERTQKSGF
ncbi:TlpA family protein disulfide reductase [Croceimicrobium sp.]|uniref:TlpA family protein disulfide reductase n=1 Tax=Croceimicrobium sp. TaxID=2828340 RepID=UPI003BAA3A95